ncbi:MAG: sugar phosphorylase [Chloroflexi bacterium AL-N5]|nr:sugar phosphorylase [Chloroflexi bacterium AL-N5]
MNKVAILRQPTWLMHFFFKAKTPIQCYDQQMNLSELQRLQMQEHLNIFYPSEIATHTMTALTELLESYRPLISATAKAPSERLSEQDIILITYGDQVQKSGEAPLKTLHGFLNRHLKDCITGVHILPFYPYTSDDGFSVADYLKVDPALGDWADVSTLGKDYRLMFDAVINHSSARHHWFQGFLAAESPYRDYFITENPETDLSMIVRPRTSPLLTAFETVAGTKHVWTTFSSDQVDLNFANPQVLLEMTKILLEYVRHGASIIRLDAVTYLWKEVGHPSVHHPKTHRVLQLIRSVLEDVSPHVVMLTETNVPHAENVSYFGDGMNEAQMVYNFALPPLTLYSFMKQDASHLQNWAARLTTPSKETTFFNFLASHDGIGVRPVEQLLGSEAIAELVKRVTDHGGLVSFKSNADGSQSPYELNINYFDALNSPTADEALELQVRRFVTAQSIMLSLAGVPGIYIHSLLGSRSHHAGVQQTGHNRSINREKLSLSGLEHDLSDPSSLRSQVLAALTPLLVMRRSSPAFHPQSPQQVLETQAQVFALKRGEGQEAVYCLHNLSQEPQAVDLAETLTDIFSSEQLSATRIPAFGTRWLRPS